MTYTDRQELLKAIVDLPFEHKLETASLDLGIIVLLLADKEANVIHRVALSNTELAKGTTDISVKRFEDIKIPLDYPDNVIATAIERNEPQMTADWQYLFAPALTPEEARLNQAAGAIACSAVYPLRAAHVSGALIFSYYQYPEKVGAMQQKFMQSYSQIVAAVLSRMAA